MQFQSSPSLLIVRLCSVWTLANTGQTQIHQRNTSHEQSLNRHWKGSIKKKGSRYCLLVKQRRCKSYNYFTVKCMKRLTTVTGALNESVTADLNEGGLWKRSFVSVVMLFIINSQDLFCWRNKNISKLTPNDDRTTSQILQWLFTQISNFLLPSLVKNYFSYSKIVGQLEITLTDKVAGRS